MRLFVRSLAVACIVSTIAFSRPIRRLAAVVTNDGIFQKALLVAEVGDPVAFGVKFANTLSSDPRICEPVQQLVSALMAGEGATGVNSIGDRAIVGARKLLGLENDGDAGFVSIFGGLLDGSYPDNVKAALQKAIQNPTKTLESLETYKFLVDTQVALNNLATTTQNIGGNSSIVSTINDQIKPVLVNVEGIIDKIGSDFSVGNVVSQGEDINQILDALNQSSQAIANLRDANTALASSVTALTNTAIDSMESLVQHAQAAAAVTDPLIPDEVFTDFPGPGTACV